VARTGRRWNCRASEFSKRGGIAESFDAERLDTRLQAIHDLGVPNYFGPQRFGHSGGNLRLAARLFAGERLSRQQRDMAISSARSLLFNDVLSARVTNGTWNTIMAGEPVNLDGSGSYFFPGSIDDELLLRLDAFDVHPTGPLWGAGDSGCAPEYETFERKIVAANEEFCDGLVRAGATMDRRALRLVVKDLDWLLSADTLEIGFQLGRGSYATVVLREVMSGNIV